MRNAMLTLKTTLKTATSGTVGSILKPALFAVLMWTALRGRCRADSGHAGADHATDVRGDAGRADAAVEAGRRRDAHVSGSRRGSVCRCSPAALPPWHWLARAPAS